MKRILIIALLAFTAPAAMAFQTQNMKTFKVEDAKPISADDFSQVMSFMKGRASEEAKLKAAVKGLKKGVFNIDQITEVIDHMRDENSRLEFAKKAYDQCPEKEAYREIVDEKFQDAASITALTEYISEK